MQTHKNIEESYVLHTGYELTSAIELYRAGDKYFIAAEKQSLRKHYPAIHDSIFLDRNNEPTWEKIKDEKQQKVYRSISAGTASVLQKNDGYASLDVLSDEIRNNPQSWTSVLPANVRQCQVKAEIDGTSTTWAEEASPAQLPVTAKLVSTIDQVCIDWPGTIAYNIAIPVMAPFVFFYEFLNED